MKNFRTYKIAIDFYRATLELNPPTHLRDQLNRAASSIVLNLAEGRGRASQKEKHRFYNIAFGSLRECQAILDLIAGETSEEVLLADKLAAHIFNLMKSTRRAT